MGRLLLVGMGVMGRPYLTAAHAAGRAVTIIDLERNLELPETRRELGPDDRTVAVDGGPDESWYLAANAAVRDDPPAAVLAFAEQHVRTAALIADEWGLPGPGLRAAETSRNKALQRAVFGRFGVPQPAFRLAESHQDAVRLAAEGGYPLVAKELSGTGSSGVRLVRDDSDLVAYTMSRPATPFLLEQYVSGPESSCEAVVAGGEPVFLSLTDKTTGPPPYFVEEMHIVPGPRAEAVRPLVEAVTRDVVRALGMRAGLLHMEFRLTSDGLAVMEVAVRTPGDFLMDLVRLAHGVDLFAAAVAVALGEQPDVAPSRKAVAASWFPTYPDGVLAISGSQQAAEAVPGAHRVRLWGEPGNRLVQRSSDDRIASVIATADDHGELTHRLAAIRDALGISVQPG